jgi:hypothetical protein
VTTTGAALIVVLLAMALMMWLGLALVLGTAGEVLVASHFVTGEEAFYAADAGLESAVDEIDRVPDWSLLLQGAVRSVRSDGPPSGARRLVDGTTIDLAGLTNTLNCGHAAACTPAEMDASVAARPWGANNPRWTLYAYGPANDMIPGESDSVMYVVTWVADDQSETDNDPTTDGASGGNPGSGLIVVHSDAYGPADARRTVEATIARPLGSMEPTRVVAWRSIR